MGFIFFLLLGLFGIAAIVFLVLTIMKKPYMWIGLIVSTIITIFAGGGFILSLLFSFAGDVTDSSTPAMANVGDEIVEEEEEVKNKEKEDEKEKYIEVNKEFEVNGLEIEITDVEITEKEVKIGMKLKNNSESVKTLYPDQGDIIIGNKQIGANMFMTKGDVSGDIHPGVEKEGTLRFLDDDKSLKAGEIKKIKLAFGNIYDEEYSSETFEETISLE